ncbi:MAG: MBG domain-containing protein [Proteobacteria bacterium]|nr:MBG domain-containing protein [Pseudomonadota bacterium]
MWNDKTATFVATSELAKGAGKKSSSAASKATTGTHFALKWLALSVMLAFGPSVYALPTGGAVSAGNASIATATGSMTISQASQNTAINWQSFNIGSGEAVRFVQPNSNSVALNRVLGADPSSILGTLSANGKVFLVNPSGVLFGKGAQVNVGGLVASTLNITDGDFMAGNYKFAGAGNGSIVNQGSINADGGYVALLGASVSNQGVISAQFGTVALAAGNAITLDVAGDGLLNVLVDQGAVNALVHNGGLIQADGGQVLLTARSAGNLLQSAVNNTGVIQARSIENRNGTIRLLGDMQNGVVNLDGKLDASAPNGGDGGFIETSAAHLKVADGAIVTTLAAEGKYGKSGTWLIDPKDFTVAAGADIAGSTLSGNLVTGNVTILSDSGAAGTLGNVNINEAVTWTAATTLTLNAVQDVNVNAAITATGGNLVSIAGRDANFKAAITTTRGNITSSSGRDLNINAAVTTTDGNFTACCGRDINVTAAMTMTRGNVLLRAGNDGSASGRAGGSVNFAPGTPKYAVTGPGAAVTLDYTPSSYTTPTDYSGNFTLTGGATLTQHMLVFVKGNDKVYDGNTNATLSFAGNPNVGGNVVTLVQGTATFDDKNVAPNLGISFSGYTLGGADAAKFSLWASCIPGPGRTSAAILAAPLSIRANDGTKVYGQTFTPAGTAFTTPVPPVAGETVGSVTETSSGTPPTAGVAGSPYAITPSNATGGTFIPSNYTITYLNGALAVTPAPMTVKANDATKVYGQTFTPAGTAFTTPVAPQNGETVGSVTEASPSGTPPTASVIGSPYAITASNATGGTFTPSNYTITYLNGALAVTPAPLTVKANDATKVYGQTFTPAGTAFTTPVAPQNGETVGSVTEASPAGTPATAAVRGPYAITPSAATGGTFVPSNYLITYVNGALTVTPAPLTVKANDATKVFGDTFIPSNTAFTTPVAPQNGETVGSVTETSPGTPATAVAPGPYAITPSAATGGTFTPSNYTITYLDGALAVTPVVVPPIVIPPVVIPPDVIPPVIIPPVVIPPEVVPPVVTPPEVTPPGTVPSAPAAAGAMPFVEQAELSPEQQGTPGAQVIPLLIVPAKVLPVALVVVPARPPAIAPAPVPPAIVPLPAEAPPKAYVAPVHPRKQDRN